MKCSIHSVIIAQRKLFSGGLSYVRSFGKRLSCGRFSKGKLLLDFRRLPFRSLP
jgi:hypothetical protein